MKHPFVEPKSGCSFEEYIRALEAFHKDAARTQHGQVSVSDLPADSVLRWAIELTDEGSGSIFSVTPDDHELSKSEWENVRCVKEWVRQEVALISSSSVSSFTEKDIPILLKCFHIAVGGLLPRNRYLLGGLLARILSTLGAFDDVYVMANVLYSACHDYPHCNRHCYETESHQLQGAIDPNHDCEDVSLYFNTLAASLVYNLKGGWTAQHREMLCVFVNTRFEKLSAAAVEVKKTAKRVESCCSENNNKKKYLNVQAKVLGMKGQSVNQILHMRKTLLKRNIFFHKGVEDEKVESGLLCQMLRCLGVLTIVSVIDSVHEEVRESSPEPTSGSSFHWDKRNMVYRAMLNSDYLCLMEYMRESLNAASRQFPDKVLSFCDYTPSELESFFIASHGGHLAPLNLKPSNEEFPFLEEADALDVNGVPDPLYRHAVAYDEVKWDNITSTVQRLHTISTWFETTETLVALANTIAILTPDSGETDRLGSCVINAYANCLYWCQHGTGVANSGFSHLQFGVAAAVPWKLSSHLQDDSRRVRQLEMIRSCTPGLIRNMNRSAHLMYVRDIVDIDASMGYTTWLLFTNQIISPRDELIWWHPLNYSSETVELTGKYPHVERRMFNQNEFNEEERAFGVQQVPLGDAIVASLPSIADTYGVNKILAPTYDFELLKLKRAWEAPWTISTHGSFHRPFRDAVFQLMLIGRFFNIVDDIIFLVVECLPRDFWGDDDVLCWSRACSINRLIGESISDNSTKSASPRKNLKLRLCKCKMAYYCSAHCRKSHAFDFHERRCGFSPCVKGLTQEEKILLDEVEGTKSTNCEEGGAGDDDDNEEDDDDDWSDIDSDELSEDGISREEEVVQLSPEEETEKRNSTLINSFFAKIHKKTRMPHPDSESESSSESSYGDDDFWGGGGEESESSHDEHEWNESDLDDY